MTLLKSCPVTHRTDLNNDNFIMLPTVDFCFKELMQNEKVRHGFLAALLGKRQDEISTTELLPTILRKKSLDDKYGILDVRIRMTDGTQIDLEMQVALFEFWTQRILFYLSNMYTDQIKEGDSYSKLEKTIHVSILNFTHFPEDTNCYRKIAFCDVTTGDLYSDLMEIHILELPKLPPKAESENPIFLWMRFLSGTCKEDFEIMAQKDPYIEEAYQTLTQLSADEQKKLEYQARARALSDYNTQMMSAEKRGFENGEKVGFENGDFNRLKKSIQHMQSLQKSPEEIALLLDEPLETILKFLSRDKL